MPQKSLNIIIVDDEEEACENLRNILLEFIDPGLDIVGIAQNTFDAERLIAQHKPDAVFLDIEMPVENAFKFLERIFPINFNVVFVTAYDEYAVRAFRLNALDYILKPISIPELKQAVDRLKEKVLEKRQITEDNIQVTKVLQQIKTKTRQNNILLKDNNIIEIVEFKDILFVEANGSYSKFCFRKNNQVREITSSLSIADCEEALPPNIFYRIHKSYMVNCNLITKIIKEENAQVLVNDTFLLPVGRRRYLSLVEFLDNKKTS